MQPWSYEPLGKQRIDGYRHEAEDRRLAALADHPRRRITILAAWTRLRGSLARLASVGQRPPVDVARPRRDLGAP